MPTENQIAPSPHRPLAASLTSRVVLDHEDPEEFGALHQLHTDRFLPRDVVEINLVDRMVVAQWRIDRIRIVHSAELQRRFNKNSPANGAHAQLAESFIDQARLSEFATLDAHEARLERSYDRALRTLQQFREKELKLTKRTQEVVENKPEPECSYRRLGVSAVESPEPQPQPQPQLEPPSSCLSASVVEQNPLPQPPPTGTPLTYNCGGGRDAFPFRPDSCGSADSRLVAGAPAEAAPARSPDAR